MIYDLKREEVLYAKKAKIVSNYKTFDARVFDSLRSTTKEEGVLKTRATYMFFDYSFKNIS